MTEQRVYLSPPDVGELEQEYVLRALQSGWVAPLGPEVDAFENEMASRLEREYAVALSSGTAGLHLGLLALGAGPGDVVVTATMTFAATVNAITYTGAEPFLVDCDLETGNIDSELLIKALDQLDAAGKRVAAVVPVDLLGKTADYDAIKSIADSRNIPVLADAAESLGAKYKGKPAGSFGEAAILSFNGNKIMTTSGGGMLLTDRKDIADRVRYLATQARQPVVHYEHQDIGYNYRLSNLLAALGRAQLSRLDSMLEARRKLRDQYKELFASVAGVAVFGGSNDKDDNCWLTSIVVDPKISGWSSRELAEVFSEMNIESRPLWKPMHLQPVYSQVGALTNGNSQWLFEHGLTLPSGSGMTPSQQETVFHTVNQFLREYR